MSRNLQATNEAFDRTVTSDTVGGLNLGFPGQMQDGETGLWHNTFRDYDAVTGRYIQTDPIGLEGGLNTYGYARNNPTQHTDENGLQVFNFNPIQSFNDLIDYIGIPDANVSLGAGGFGQFFMSTFSADSGVAIDTRGTVCFYSSVCSGLGAGLPLQGTLGIVGSLGSGKLCSGETEGGGPFWLGGAGLMGQGQVTYGSNGLAMSRGLIGVGGSPEGAAGGTGYMECTYTYICSN